VPFWLGMPMTLVFMFVFGIASNPDPAPDDRRADHFRHHGHDWPIDRVPGRVKWIFGVNPQPFRACSPANRRFSRLQIQTVY